MSQLVFPLRILAMELAVIIAFRASTTNAAADSEVAPVQLRCEYLSNPEGIDVAQPRLSWTFHSGETPRRGWRQTAYQILVADSPVLLADGKGNLWDSGKTVSDAAIHIAYAGKPLPSSIEGPIRRASIYFGETYDAEREMPGWDLPDFAAKGWEPVEVLPHPTHIENPRLVAQPNEPIRVVKELRPVRMGATTIWERRDAKETAVIVCDMWQRHWCDGAVGRCNEMAPRINAFVGEARRRGALIVHSPSGGVNFYQSHPARKRAAHALKAANLPSDIDQWRHQIESEKKAKWPIDQSDGGCDCQPRCPKRPMDVHQTDAIAIHEEDAISDSGAECWNLFEQRGIKNVMLLGVHTNMCVLGRPFGLRNLVRFGKNVLLVRDLTDAMYNSRKSPFVSHVRGTELIVEHIEKYVCPTIASSDLLGGPAFRFREDDRPHVAMIAADDEYGSEQTLPAFAQMLRERHGCYCTDALGHGRSDISGLDELQKADGMVLFVRRRALPKRQLDMIRDYLNHGKPLVALRTSSHAFSIHGRSPAGYDQWPEFDRDILGGNYHGHGNGRTEVGPAPGAENHPTATRPRTSSGTYGTARRPKPATIRRCEIGTAGGATPAATCRTTASTNSTLPAGSWASSIPSRSTMRHADRNFRFRGPDDRRATRRRLAGVRSDQGQSAGRQGPRERRISRPGAQRELYSVHPHPRDAERRRGNRAPKHVARALRQYQLSDRRSEAGNRSEN